MADERYPEFRVEPHSIRSLNVVELVIDGRIVGVIYPVRDGIRVISAHLKQIGTETDEAFPGQAAIRMLFNQPPEPEATA